ncbi:MAG TPA: hypothetical protein VGF48_06490 [Thermoanaerobaculia bacterium]|jgi:hypothetical protein
MKWTSVMLFTLLPLSVALAAPADMRVVQAVVAPRELAPGLTVALQLPVDSTLPAAPVPLHLRIRNVGTPVTLSRGVQVRMTSPAGETFAAEWGGDVRQFGTFETAGNAPVTVNTGGVVEVTVPATDFSNPSWALDQRLMKEPGAWGIEVLLFEHGRKREAGPIAISSRAALRIETPTETERATWEAIQRREWNVALQTVYPARRDSPYFPYLAIWFATENPLQKAHVLGEALARHPSSPVAPWLRFSLAYYYAAVSQSVFSADRDIEKAVEYADLARRELLRLKQSPDLWVSSKASERLQELPDREHYVERRKAFDKANMRRR